jgi:hypothetical protein
MAQKGYSANDDELHQLQSTGGTLNLLGNVLPGLVVHFAEVSNAMNWSTVFSQLATLEKQTCGTSPWSVVRANVTSDIRLKEVTCIQIRFIKIPGSYHASTDYVYSQSS